jgi:hypothetical protein
VGDRIQFNALANNLRVANRELGTIESIDGDGRLRLKIDGGRTVELDPRKYPLLDHGYAHDQPLQSGTDCRPCPYSRGHRVGRLGSAQQPHGLRFRLT